MKRLLYACAALILAFTPVAAKAATDVSGTWTGAMAGGQGGFQLSFTFKQDGATLTGSVKGPQGDPIAISEGKVDGDKISFKVVIQGGTTITHEGTLNATGDEIKLTTKSDNGQFPGGEMTLTRAKAPPPPTN
jgi:opacity protein-like surface antigen